MRIKAGNNVVFLYPGQGSQQVGMGLDLYQTYPEVKEIFHQADHLLGFSLSQLCFEGPEEKLNRDLNAQLAVYTISCIVTEVLKGHDVFPNMVAGYSSGFYAAAYASGCFDFAYGLYLVRRAGEILLDEGRKIDGSMAVIFGLSPEKIDTICQQVGDVQIAILNTPQQTIISGIRSSVMKAMDLSLNKGALDAYNISTATAYHSIFMQQSSTRLLGEVKEDNLKDPQLPLFSYFLLESVSNKKELKKIMAAQLSGPVSWVDLIKKLHNNNILFIEAGPGAVISRTVKWVDRNIEIVNTDTQERLLESIQRYRGLRKFK
jgi:[acyl-carrier-protein] S-malonyltransferase